MTVMLSMLPITCSIYRDTCLALEHEGSTSFEAGAINNITSRPRVLTSLCHGSL